MNILLLCIFIVPTFVLLSTVNGQGNSEKPIICSCEESSDYYSFHKYGFPCRCTTFLFFYYFDMANEMDSHLFETSRNSIDQLKKDHRPVYFYVDDVNKSNSWLKIFNNAECKGQEYIDLIEPLKKFIKDLLIEGIIIPISINEIENMEGKLQMIIEDLQSSKSDLKVSLNFDYQSFEFFTNKVLFNFTKVNNIIEYYIITLSDLNTCDGYTRDFSINPLSSTNSSLITMERVWENITSSNIDIVKVIAILQVAVSYLETNNWNSYTEYCSMNESNKLSWCSDASKTLYDQGQFVGNHFQGLMLSDISMDDYNTSCQCTTKFPVSNIIIDGFLNQSLTVCEALD